jgi:hypothetical protein
MLLAAPVVVVDMSGVNGSCVSTEAFNATNELPSMNFSVLRMKVNGTHPHLALCGNVN